LAISTGLVNPVQKVVREICAEELSCENMHARWMSKAEGNSFFKSLLF